MTAADAAAITNFPSMTILLARQLSDEGKPRPTVNPR